MPPNPLLQFCVVHIPPIQGITYYRSVTNRAMSKCSRPQWVLYVGGSLFSFPTDSIRRRIDTSLFSNDSITRILLVWNEGFEKAIGTCKPWWWFYFAPNSALLIVWQKNRCRLGDPSSIQLDDIKSIFSTQIFHDLHTQMH